MLMKVLSAGWKEGRTLPQRIVVPFAYQTELSGINDQSIHEIVWYARDFEVPAFVARAGHCCCISARSIIAARCGSTAQEVGHNQGGHVPFWFDIAPYLREGSNRFTLRVEDRQDAHQPRGKQSVSGVPNGIDYYCTTGIWQTVWLEPAPPMRIQELNITPHLEDENLELRVFLHAPSIGWQLQAEVLDGGEIVARSEENTATSSVRLTLHIPDAKPWSPASPHLYDIRVRLLRDGRVLDEIESYAGMRSIQLRDRQFLLNGTSTYLAMVLDQGYWPDGGMTPPSE
jgi:beta-galactosidase/beta-glucuronidase